MYCCSRVKIILLFFILGIKFNLCQANIYVAFYATKNGNTGHIGIAIDNYDIKVNDLKIEGTIISKEDSVANGTITYFDFWPAVAVIKIWQIHNEYEPLYIQYPKSEFEEPYYLSDLYVKGIPKKKKRILDGLLEIRTTAKQDFELYSAIQDIRSRNKKYNAVKNNCTDFVLDVLKSHFKLAIKLKKENILFVGFHTPNRLFSYLLKNINVNVLIDPKEKVKGSFFKERFLKRIFYKKSDFDEKMNTIT